MIQHLRLPLAVVAALVIAGCSAQQSLFVTRPHTAIQERGAAVIGATLDRDLLSSLVVEYINLYRSQRNLPLVYTEHNAKSAALWMADYQASRSQVTHVAADDPAMRRFKDRYKQNGGGSYSAGYENTGWYPLFDPQLGRNHTYDEMARNILDGWINSPSHHKALVVKGDGANGVIGLGVAAGACKGTNGIFATMNLFFYMPEPKVSYNEPPTAPAKQGAAEQTNKSQTKNATASKGSAAKKKK